MASIWYNKGLEHIANGDVNWSNSDIRVALLITGVGHYVIDAENDEFLGVITTADRPELSDLLTNKEAANGELVTMNPAVFVSPTPGNFISALAIFLDSGDETSSILLCYVDLAGTGEEFTTNGEDLEIDFTSYVGKI